MEQLKNNQFAVAIAGIIVVYIVLYMFIVSPVYTDSRQGIEILKKKLSTDQKHLDKYLKGKRSKGKNKKGKKEIVIPSERLIKYHTQKKEQLTKAKEKIYGIFKSKSQSLKKPFEEVKAKEQQNGAKVSLAYFQAVYEKEVSDIIKKYAGENEGMRIGQQKEDDFFDGVSDKEKQVRGILRFDGSRSIVSTTTQAEAQKKFWIIKNTLDLMETSKVSSLKQLLVRKQEERENSAFEEYKVEIIANMNFENIPLLIQKILQSQEMLTEITQVDMARNESYTPEDISVFIKIGQTKEQALEEALQKKGISAIPVTVKIGCKILNYVEN
ncbi:hypothetical protein [Candidatus Uabimicrobium sp. HlEnr_7]|uniref:hypothetical protein n=1 Tax=Candidatus Uabimicrobium helgolandensis TaxID=3095367 RepID=UPI003557D212